MPSRFQRALENNPAFERLGDVKIRYEPSLLIAEADRVKPGWVPVAALCVGVAGATSLIAAGLANGSSGWLAASALAMLGGFFGAIRLRQQEKRQRRFVLNFGTYALRLDFSTPIAGKPKTMVMHFDLVRGLDLLEQADGKLCLTIDFAGAKDSNQVLREVLVAHVPGPKREELERLQRLLHDAFDLGRQNSPSEADPEVAAGGSETPPGPA
ncbi:MAG: hypothetical protein QM723_07655 [Myxococcaceae bacterium]